MYGCVSVQLSHLASLTGMDTIVKSRSHISTHFAQQHHSIQF